MSYITLSSKEYCESVFADGPKFDKLSAFVSGPGAQVQGKLTASTGIILNNNVISVNTARSVGTSNLPVTASAVNTKLGDYVNDIQADADCPIGVSRSGSSVTLSPNGSSGSKWITAGTDWGQTWVSLGKDKNGATVNSVFVSGPLYDQYGNEITGGGSGSSFNYISESDDWPTSLLLGKGPDGGVAGSVFICGPLYGNKGSIFVAGPIVFNEAYDKDGNEITGGSPGGGSKWISDDTQGGKTILNLGHGSAGTVNSIYVCGPVKMHHESSPQCGTATIGLQENAMDLGGFEIKYEGSNGTKTCIWIASDTPWDNAAIEIDMYKYDGTLRATLFLDANKLNKLSSLLDNADALLALLKN